jgi:signal transduction histidine kinase
MKKDEKVKFTFRDDGKGFVMNGQNVGNGLNNVKRRAKMINAEISIKNDTAGTVAELEIPV